MQAVDPEEIETTYPITDSNRVDRELPDDPTEEHAYVRVVQTSREYAVELVYSAEGETDETKTFTYTNGEVQQLSEQIRAGDATSFIDWFGERLAEELATELKLAGEWAGSRAVAEMMGEDVLAQYREGKLTEEEVMREFTRRADEALDLTNEPSIGFMGDVNEEMKNDIRDEFEAIRETESDPTSPSYLTETGPFSNIEVSCIEDGGLFVNAFLPLSAVDDVIVPDDLASMSDAPEDIDTSEPTTITEVIPDNDYYATFVRAVAEYCNTTSYRIHKMFDECFICTSVTEGEEGFATFTETLYPR